MATVKMKKGDKLADIFDSPETIATAQSEGYELVGKQAKADSEEKKSDEAQTPKNKK